MNKFQNLIFFSCLFSYIFSISVIKIEPSFVTFGEEVKFILTVQDYDSSDNNFYLKNANYESNINLYCSSSINNNNILNCNADININNKEELNYLIKNLYVNDIKTDLTVTIEKPKTLKLLGFDNNNEYYSYGISILDFTVNYNELYNSDVSIKFDDFSITNCTLDDESISYIKCYYVFPESSAGKSLKLIFNNNVTEYSINIKAPKKFSVIYHLYKDTYYSSSSIQDIIFDVDSSYKMNEHSIVLESETSDNEIIILSNCTYYFYDIRYAKCSGILNKNDAYYVYYDNQIINEKLFVYPEQNAITKVQKIKPNELLISSSSTTFTLDVDYIVNFDKAIFTLVDKFNNDNKIGLTNCSKVDKSNDLITCVGTLTKAGNYYVYLNGVKQDENIRVYSSSLSKALYIDRKIIKFIPEKSIKIEIYFDSVNDLSSKDISLIGNNNNIANLKIKEINDYNSYSVEYGATFPAVDIYYVYIDGVKQDISIIVTDEAFTSKVTSISPTLVNSDKQYDIHYALTVDTNLGIEEVDIDFKNDYDDYSYGYLSCKADSSDISKAKCLSNMESEGNYFVAIDKVEFKDVRVTVKKLPSLKKFSPISIPPSNNKQNIIFYFQEDISKYVNRVTFVGNENIKAECETSSKYYLNCSAVFKKEDIYFITFDGVNMGESIYVNKENNVNGINYLKISFILISLILLF